MRPLTIFVTTAMLGLALSLLAGMLGFLIGGLFLFALIPFFGRDRWAAMAGSLVGFGAGWTLLVQLQLGRGGTSGNDPVWLAVGIVPMLFGIAIVAALVLTRRPPDPGGGGSDTLP